jgi:hypothetical protein
MRWLGAFREFPDAGALEEYLNGIADRADNR